MSDYQSLPQHDQEEAGDDVDQSDKTPFYRRKSTLIVGAAVIVLLGVAAYVLGSANEWSHHRVHFEGAGISSERYAQGLSRCRAINKEGRHAYPAAETRTVNPRFVAGTAPTLFKNGTIFDGATDAFQGDILVDNGLIVEVGGEIEAPEGATVIDLKGHIITPGIIDMHSHLGVDSWPGLDGTDDTNEMSQPLTPFVRSIDGFNPSDKARKWVVSGGVTTSLILPGSGNIMGGEGFLFKLRKVDTLSSEEMLAETGVKNKWRYMKMACGENPKRVYGDEGRMPTTRLGEAWLLREQFARASDIKVAQDDWCDAALGLPRYGRHRLNAAFPEDARYEALVGILRNDVRLHIHCYETQDLEAMVRHSNEFKFKISAFHHALDAYRAPEILKRAYKHTPTVATFAGKYGYKKEALQSSVNAPKILAEAGIPVAMKSDHPVLNSQHLVYEAAQAHHHGLSELLSIASVTSVPAKALGQDHRIGKIAVGMDADLVIWEKHPLSLGSHPLQVYIDGIAQIENVNASTWTPQDEPRKFVKYPKMVVDAPEGMPVCSEDASTGYITGIKKIILNDFQESDVDGDLSIIVERGQVACMGRCNQKMAAMGNDVPVYDLGGEGIVLPTLLSVGAPNLGLIEIDSESSSGNGQQGLSSEIVYAADGLKFGGIHMDEAYKAGVLAAVTAPSSEHVVQGVSVAFLTGADNALSEHAIIKENVALHVQIGHDAKSKSFPTVSSQIGFLRSALERGLNDLFPGNDEFALAARGKIPLVIEVHNRDEIIRIIQIKRDLEENGADIKITLVGATEAWTVAEYLAEADIGVILRPFLCTPAKWTAQRCLPGAPLSEETGLSVLYKAGVKVGLAADEPEDVRQLSWIAGWAKSDLGLDDKQAVGLVSWNLAELVGLHPNPSGLVIYSGDPFEFRAKISIIVGGGKSGIQCNPRAF